MVAAATEFHTMATVGVYQYPSMHTANDQLILNVAVAVPEFPAWSNARTTIV